MQLLHLLQTSSKEVYFNIVCIWSSLWCRVTCLGKERRSEVFNGRKRKWRSWKQIKQLGDGGVVDSCGVCCNDVEPGHGFGGWETEHWRDWPSIWFEQQSSWLDSVGSFWSHLGILHCLHFYSWRGWRIWLISLSQHFPILLTIINYCYFCYCCGYFAFGLNCVEAFEFISFKPFVRVSM